MSTQPVASPATPTAPAYIISPYYGLQPVTMTSAMYWLAQPLAVQALKGMALAQGLAAAATLATTLANGGYAIDYAIMVLGMDPLSIMSQRFIDGLTWVPRLGSENDFTNTLINPGAPSYNYAMPPADAILVSISAAAYPPILPPVPVAIAANNVVGALQPDGNFAMGPGTLNAVGQPKYTEGFILAENGHNYVAVLTTQGMFNVLEWKQTS